MPSPWGKQSRAHRPVKPLHREHCDLARCLDQTDVLLKRKGQPWMLSWAVLFHDTCRGNRIRPETDFLRYAEIGA
jgi:hypothetical protein